MNNTSAAQDSDRQSGIIWQLSAGVIFASVLLNIVLNVSIFVVFLQHSKFFTVTGRIIILNLAVSDILRGINCDLANGLCFALRGTGSDLNNRLLWLLGRYQPASCPAFYSAMLYFIAGLSASRLIHLRGPYFLVYNRRMAQMVYCGLVWSLIPIIYAIHYLAPMPTVELGSTLTYTWRLETNQDWLQWALATAGGMVAPCTVIGITYILLSRIVQHNTASTVSQEISKATLFIFLTGSLLIAPILVSITLTPVVAIHDVVYVMSMTMSSFNGVNNAVILVYFCKQYRGELKQFMQCCVQHSDSQLLPGQQQNDTFL